jgi:tetratricopeptide (TPR) repeat protein
MLLSCILELLLIAVLGCYSPTAKSYMKMADAYLDKRQYTLASKQFLKVIKKAPEHLPAYLGYATALERAGNTKQMHTAALAYGNATKLAITQGDKVDPLAMTGTGGIGENILRRAVVLAKTSPHKKLETLKQLNAYAHTAVIAADIYHEIGLEIVRQGIEQEDKKRDAIQAFSFANEFIATRNDTQTPYHVGSIVELGKLALLKDDARSVIDLFNKVKNVHMEDDVHVELLVLVGRAYVVSLTRYLARSFCHFQLNQIFDTIVNFHHSSRQILGELETAITEFTRALSFPESSSTASAHYELASTLKKNNGDEHEINLHFEMSLNLGMDPSSEVIDALGENSMAVVRALRRQHYRSMNDDVQSDTRAGGGIMSGGGVHSTSSSAFAPQSKHSEDATTGQSETLSILEQGAASYDGHTPMGGGIEGTESSLSNLKAKKQQGSESNLSSLRR